jgi:SlyX protein
MVETQEERIVELEMRLAHMERTVDALSVELHEAHRSRDELASQFEVFKARLQAMFEDSSDMLAVSDEPPPPHY